MKKGFVLFLVIVIYLQLPAQNVGIGNTNPQTALHLKGKMLSHPEKLYIT